MMEKHKILMGNGRKEDLESILGKEKRLLMREVGRVPGNEWISPCCQIELSAGVEIFYSLCCAT